MYTPGTVIDNKYVVINVLNPEGGMGVILRVFPMGRRHEEFALKYCEDKNTENLDRFRREVRLMCEFIGNPRVVQILDHNLASDPPYFVMPIYPDGDLRTLIPNLKNDLALQEQTFVAMADCVAELHKQEKHHRDIKPANFLRTNYGLVISDLGLGNDTQSVTGCTKQSQWWGTHGYLPPEFLRGGFKDATPPSDIFMLGKTIYNLLTGLDPTYIDRSQVPLQTFYLIQRCCEQDPKDRFQTIADLKTGIKNTYDVLLKRLLPFGSAQQKYEQIVSLLAIKQYQAQDYATFVAAAEGISPEELYAIIANAEEGFYYVLSQDVLRSELRRYLELYKAAYMSPTYPAYEYAETVARNMRMVFNTSTDHDLRATALEMAIQRAHEMNRYAAMSTCSNMVTGVEPGDLGVGSIIAALQRTSAEFIKLIEPTACKNAFIADAVKKLAANDSQLQQ